MDVCYASLLGKKEKIEVAKWSTSKKHSTIIWSAVKAWSH
jgi:hypothetical protein